MPAGSLPMNKRMLKIPDVEKKINDRMEDLVDAMLDLALGHYKMISKFNPETGDVEQKVYVIEPDYKALAFLIENVMGKVPQRVEMTGDGGGPIKVIPWMTMAEAIRTGMMPQLQAGEDEETSDPDSDAIPGEFTHVIEEVTSGNEN